MTTTAKLSCAIAAATFFAVGCSQLGTRPHPAYGPAEVVRLQVEALARDEGGSGIAVAYRFASPRNKPLTGPLERFARVVQAPSYRPMLRHRAAEYGPALVSERNAVQVVRVTAWDGSRHTYLFELSKQRGGSLPGCWLTDSVTRLESEEVERVEV